MSDKKLFTEIGFSDSFVINKDKDIKERCDAAMKVAAKKLKVESFDIEEAYYRK